MSVLPTFAGTSDQVVITYGETTYANQQYKSLVDDFFAGKIDVNLNDVESKVITAGDVNAISSGFSGKSYNSNQIVSCALLDLNQNGEITVDVDNSITTITPKMYMSALCLGHHRKAISGMCYFGVIHHPLLLHLPPCLTS